MSWDNEALVATDITLGIGAAVTAVALSGLSVLAVPLQTDSAVGIAADNDGAADFVGTDAFAVVGGQGDDSDSASLVAGLAPYVGLGTFDVTLSAVVETFVSTTGGFGPIDPDPGVVFGLVSVTYEFTPIPEPSTGVLISLGLVASVALRPGRRSSS